MRIQIINPNTTASFTALSLDAGRAVAAPGIEIVARQPRAGTPSVESHFDEAIATIGIIEAVRDGESEGADGHVIACFGDTGLEAAREVAMGPVVGMTEAALYAAALIAPVFGIVTLPRRTRVFAERALLHAGLERRCTCIRAIDVDVLHCEDETAMVFEAFLVEAQRAVDEDHAEAIILGCAGLEPLIAPLTRRLGVPVIEGVAAAVTQVEGLLRLGLKTSKGGAWGLPPPKPLSGFATPLSAATPDAQPQRGRP
jgi:allantoin racemase